MSGAAADRRRAAPPRRHVSAACSAAPLGAVGQLRGADACSSIVFLVPPFYMLITSLKTSAEISAQQGSPWWSAPPDAGELHAS